MSKNASAKPIDIAKENRAKLESNRVVELGPALNRRQRAFVREAAGRALTGTTLKAAYERAGYSLRCTGGPQKLMANPRIAHEIEVATARKAREMNLNTATIAIQAWRIACTHIADFIEFDSSGHAKVNDGRFVLRSNITREELEGVAKFSIAEGGIVADIDRWPSLKAMKEWLLPTKAKIELTGKDEGPLQIDLTKMSDDDLAAVERVLKIFAKSGSGEGGSGPEGSGTDGSQPQ